jgi:hypothetical protein
MSATAPEIKTGYEIANALGRLNSDRPKLGEACMSQVPVAKAVRYMLMALDLYQQQTGKSAEQIGRDVARGRIELRLDGNRATVVCP